MPQVNSILSKVYKPVVHRTETIIIIRDNSDIEQILRLFNIKEEKESSGEKYTVHVFKEDKGESVSVYQYKDKTVVRVNTHRLKRRRYVIDYINHFSLQVTRDYMELYYRISSRYETIVNNALFSYAETKGLGLFSQTVTRGWDRLVYLTRTDKHTLSQDLYAVLKLYRDKALREDPKLEIEFFAPRLLTDSDIQLAGRILNTIIKLTKARVILNDYDRQQDTIELLGYDPSLHRALFSTIKRISLTMLLNKNYRDKRLAIAELLDRGLRPVDISRLTGYTRIRIHQIIDELLEMGIIERVGRGKYRIKTRRVKDDLQHPLPHWIIVNLEYDEVHVVTIPWNQWNKQYLIMKYTKEGWISYDINKIADGVLVFYRNSNNKYDYLLVKRSW